PLVTDRPDVTESSSTVGAARLQLESGITITNFRSRSNEATIGEILLRWGIFETLELRFLIPTYARVRGGSGDASGFLASALGGKLQLTEGDGAGLPEGMELAVIVATTVATGTGDFETSCWQPEAVLCASWPLAPTVGIGTNFGVARPAGEASRFTTVWASAALGVGLKDTMSGFIELIGFNREEERGPNTVTLQFGLTYLLNPDIQVSVEPRHSNRCAGSAPPDG
ncbi:MAG: transporter, partial [Acidobacteriota bacterium]